MEYQPIYYDHCKFLSKQRKTCNECNARKTCIACYEMGYSDEEKNLVMSVGEFMNPPESEPEIPLKKVLEDACNPDNGLVSQAARDYYIMHYASEEEEAALEREENNSIIMRTIAIIILAGLLILGFILPMIVMCFK